MLACVTFRMLWNWDSSQFVFCWRGELKMLFDVEYTYGFVGWGVCKQSRWCHSVTVPHTKWRMCYYGNVMTTRWRLYVNMETLWQQQDGGYALLWKRYSNIQITSTFAVEDVYTELVIDVFYIFNSTVIDWTCYFFRLSRSQGHSAVGRNMSITVTPSGFEPATFRYGL